MGVCGELEVFPDWPYGSAGDVLEMHLQKVWVGDSTNMRVHTA